MVHASIEKKDLSALKAALAAGGDANELAGSRLTLRRTKAPALTGSYEGATLRIESEPDDEHGLVVTSVFELQTAAAPAKKARRRSRLRNRSADSGIQSL